MALDDSSNYVWSYFIKKKSETSKIIWTLIKTLRVNQKGTVKYIRCNNAGENKKLEEDCMKEGLGIEF